MTTLDHLREIALIQISQSQRNAVMNTQGPIYFENLGSIVRGRIDKRHRNHVVTVVGEYYLRPDGTEVAIYLGFKRKLSHTEVWSEVPANLLTVMPKMNQAEAE